MKLYSHFYKKYDMICVPLCYALKVFSKGGVFVNE